jgi:hypothetical protein
MSPERGRAPVEIGCEAVREAYEDKLLRSARTFLTRWQGASARVRPVGPSHAHLAIVLSRDDVSSENLLLAVDPLWWRGFFEWGDARLTINLVDASASRAARRTVRERLFEIADPSGNFECLTEWLEVKENVRL